LDLDPASLEKQVATVLFVLITSRLFAIIHRKIFESSDSDKICKSLIVLSRIRKAVSSEKSFAKSLSVAQAH